MLFFILLLVCQLCSCLAYQPELCSTCPFISVTASQPYTVPASARYLGVYLWGAGGSASSHGAFVGGALPVTGGEELGVIVGICTGAALSQGCGGGAMALATMVAGALPFSEAAMML